MQTDYVSATEDAETNGDADDEEDIGVIGASYSPVGSYDGGDDMLDIDENTLNL